MSFLKYLLPPFLLFYYQKLSFNDPIIVAYMILAQTIPNDGQCHMVDRPLIIHYILAAIITALPTLVLIYSKKKKKK
ncbi:Holliday junction ATP-dependent DNA helicase RuvA [Rickettsia endosymbiont of Nabis limbatus]|uniref:Holliday junction ATP-dependent DNA helicase RuvA n=1 Tax=Rickettsia endosymbiont of Nabis limbatus TaxID=3066268 RepID=UPI003AF331EB